MKTTISILGLFQLLLLAADAQDDNTGSLRGADTSSSSRPTASTSPNTSHIQSFSRLLRDLLEDESSSGEPIDLDFRFNKFAFDDDVVPDFMPLTAADYPIRDEIAAALKNHSNAISVICNGDFALEENHRVKLLNYIEALGGLPTMPRDPNTHHLDNDDDAFWSEFRQVAELQKGRRQNMNPGTILRAPDLWLESRSDIHQVADAVHDEYPGALQAELIQWLWAQGVTLDYDIIPFRSNSDYVGLTVAMVDLNTWAIGAVAPMNFYMKWHVGRPRPEEVAYAITTRQLDYDHGVPPDIVELVDSLKLTSAAEFTAYPEGAPRHPAWPAMHSAASSASFWLATILDLTPAQYCEALRVDYAVAFARTCAGVHYATDNTAGLNLGQTIIAEQLPAHLAQKYGSDPDKVKAKMDLLRFDWNRFDSYGCSTGIPKLT